MNSIYSPAILQRVVDHWHIGSIEDVMYFEPAHRRIWRHWIETPQGTFELYSYPDTAQEIYPAKLESYLENRLPKLSQRRHEKRVYSFDRVHVLIQLTQKHSISPKQAAKDLALLHTQRIVDAFIVYGSIVQIQLENRSILSSYGHWNLQTWGSEPRHILAQSSDSTEKMETAMQALAQEKAHIVDAVQKDTWVEIFLNTGKSLNFTPSETFAALEIHIPFRRRDVVIFSEEKIFYSKEFSGE
ncbi:hypothetical protein LRY65_04300 [Candidatus Woesebacteria bacterium]|nr:hypothetical protein [Candidatus Woesebacteria bacterium]MCD8507559.1 hypothetical protein [Candidatus Woesebacteria bacterium]MCD8527400.1 hypothetical protein [Candidatus Woesebacteria bacterium]MCD8546147.1 hypothetical protein [Candidatus Woesebacteria bacterium]